MFKDTFSSAAVAVILAFTILSVCFAFSQAIYTGPLAAYVNLGTMLILAGTAVIILTISIFSDIPIAVARPQDEPFPLLILLVQGLVVYYTHGQLGFFTLLLNIALTTFLTGLVLFSVGYLKMGSFIRFVPFPVIAGFLASAGILLLLNGIHQVMPQNLSYQTIAILWDTPVLLLWLPTVIFGLSLFCATELIKNTLLFPSLIFGALVFFYLIFWLTGQPWETLQSSQLLLDIKPFTLNALADLKYEIQWDFVFSNLGYMFLIAFIAALSLLFILISLDLALKRDVDFNKELKIAGIANIFASFLGGIVGYHGLANTILLSKASAKSRYIGIFCGLVCFGAIFFANITLAWFPRFILSGLIVFLGLSLFYSWTLGVWDRFDKFDKIVVISVVFSSTFFGFFSGIITGFIISIIFFILTYSWINPIRYVTSANALASVHQRPPVPRIFLKNHAEKIIYVKLQNYLFFGSAYYLVMQIQKLVKTEHKLPIKFLIYDLEQVIGIDSSVEMAFKKILQCAEKYNFKVVISGYSNNKNLQLQKRISAISMTQHMTNIPRIEDAINYCELELLKHENVDMEKHEHDEIYLEDYLGDKELKNSVSKYFKNIDLGKGEHLFYQNDLSNALFYVESGFLKIYIDLNNGFTKTLSIIGPGNFVGELAFYLHTARNASICAESACILKSIDQTTLRQMRREDPEFYGIFNETIIFILATKLSESTKKLEMMSR